MKREINTWIFIFLSPVALSLSSLRASENCFESPQRDCLHSGRFEVRSYFTRHNKRNSAKVRDALTGDAATLFYFFSFDNPELMIKVIDGCGINGHYWVFASAATDLKYSFRVRDYFKGKYKYYSPSQGSLVSDISAFSCL